MDRLAQFVGFGRDDGARLELVVPWPPARPQPSERERRVVRHPDVHGLLGPVGHLRPFVESRRRDQASRGSVRVSESRLGCDRLSPGVNHPTTDRNVLRPERDETPAQLRELALALFVQSNDRDLLGRRDVVAGLDLGRVLKAERQDERRR